MKKFILVTAIICYCFACASPTDHSQCHRTIDSLKTIIEEQGYTIQLLEYPAADRLVKINSLIGSNNLEDATAELTALLLIFPNSAEASQADKLTEIIQKKKHELEKEEKRLKALGFKAFDEKKSVVVGPNTITFGSFSIANTFTFDSYDSRYFYSTADRGNKYVSGSITVKSEEKNPKLPAMYVYSINGDKLILQGRMHLRFSRWRDYGSYLGNYSDTGNDFAKTSSINFKVGCEIEEKILAEPFMLLLKNENVYERHTDRFENPPVSYKTSATGESTLTLNDLRNGKYTLVKFFNRSKL